MAKLKSQCTPEEWAAELARGRAKHRKRRSDPVKREDDLRKSKEWRETPAGQTWQRKRNREAGWRKIGFTPELVRLLFEAQNECCAVCGSFITIESCHADHCHETGAPRGLLCRACNTAEGFVRASGLPPEEFGRRLARYLGNPPATGRDLV